MSVLQIGPISSDIQVGEIVAHRIWWVPNSGGKLFSAWFSNVEWFPGEVLVARNVFQLSEFQRFGIHAFKNRLDCFRYLKDYGDRTAFAIGTVYLWGDVRIHQKGYIASHAAVKSVDEVVSMEKTWDYKKEHWKKIKIHRKPEMRNYLRQLYCEEKE